MIKNKPTLISAIRRANRLYECVMVLAFGILLGGCCAIPDFQTDHERYVNYMNSLVGKHAADLYSGIRPGYQKILSNTLKIILVNITLSLTTKESRPTVMYTHPAHVALRLSSYQLLH